MSIFRRAWCFHQAHRLGCRVSFQPDAIALGEIPFAAYKPVNQKVAFLPEQYSTLSEQYSTLPEQYSTCLEQ